MDNQLDLVWRPRHGAILFLRDLPHPVLHTVVESVISRKTELPASMRRSLEQVIRASVRVQGFARGKHVPVPILIQTVCKRIPQVRELAEMVVSAWLHLHGEICQAVVAHERVVATDPPVEKAGEDAREEFSRLALATWLAEVFRDSDSPTEWNPAIVRRDWLLASMWLNHPEPVLEAAEENRQTQGVSSHMIWNEWLSTLHALDSAAPEWDQLEVFIQELLALRAEKQAARADTAKVAKASAILAHLDSNLLRFFEFPDWGEWPASGTPSADRLLEQAERLQSLLAEYAALREQQEPETLSGRRSRQARLQEMEDRITDLRDALSTFRAGGHAEDQQSQLRSADDVATTEPPSLPEPPSDPQQSGEETQLLITQEQAMADVAEDADQADAGVHGSDDEGMLHGEPSPDDTSPTNTGDTNEVAPPDVVLEAADIRTETFSGSDTENEVDENASNAPRLKVMPR